MSYVRNGSWIVSVTKWVMEQGFPRVTHCNSRYYRNEAGARARYRAVVDSLVDWGFQMKELRVPDNEEYFGVNGVLLSEDERRYKTLYACVYIDRNRT